MSRTEKVRDASVVFIQKGNQMSGIVLSASVRQNLLSLQSTAALLATTQNDLATGNKVNSALDNPTNFFTAQGLNNRASDIGNLLDAIGNGVQVLQAANTGITSLQSLVASAQSIANQVLQSPVGYSAKSNITSAAITGATANNLLGTALTNKTVTGSAVVAVHRTVQGWRARVHDGTLADRRPRTAGNRLRPRRSVRPVLRVGTHHEEPVSAIS